MNSEQMDFGGYNDFVDRYLYGLSINSAEIYKQQVKKGQIHGSTADFEGLATALYAVKDFLYFNYLYHPNEFGTILNTIVEKLNHISCLPNNNRGIYGCSYPKVANSYILINPNMQSNGALTGHDRIKLYTAHELGHLINSKWQSDVEEYTSSEVVRGSMDPRAAELIKEGFSLLDEATTQERAEEYAYYSANKRRPSQSYTNYRNSSLFGGNYFKTNFDYYGELQQPAISFGRTLRGIGKISDDDRVMSILSNRALSPDFFSKILTEYQNDDRMRDFSIELQYMGLLKKASYANFGYGDTVYLENSSTYLNEFNKCASALRDYREPKGNQY